MTRVMKDSRDLWAEAGVKDRVLGIEEGMKHGGWFELDDGREVLGELTVSGPSTLLYLHDAEDFYVRERTHRTVRGKLHDRTKVTLLNCSVNSTMGSARNNDESFCTA